MAKPVALFNNKFYVTLGEKGHSLTPPVGIYPASPYKIEYFMMRITFLILVIHLLVIGSMAWAEEPEDRPNAEVPPPAGEPAPLPPEERSGTAPPSGLAPIPAPSGPEPPVQTVPPGAPSDEKPQEEKAAEKALEQQEEEKRRPVSAEVERAGGILGKGRLQLEITQTYLHLSSNQLFIEGFGLIPILVIGEIQVERIRRDIFITVFTTRYTIIQDLQAELRIPYQITWSRTSTAAGILGRRELSPTEEESSRSRGLGDVDFGLNYKLLEERITRPALYVGLGFKARTGRDVFETEDPALDPPTGSGFNSVKASLSVAKTSDPAVLFASLSYAYALPRKDVVFRVEGRDPTLIDFIPGDSISLGLGLAFAINYKLTLSFQVQQTITFPIHTDGKTLPKKLPNSFTNAINLRMGGVWSISDKTSIDLSVSPGLSLDAPDVRIEMRIPRRF